MKPINQCTNDFAQLREHCIYVDKTAYLHRLITATSSNLFFVARPRRFGKSLMISTLKAIFEGRRELFDGLAITRSDYDWQVSPVVWLNFGFAAAPSYDVFHAQLPRVVEDALTAAGYAYDKTLQPSDNFARAIDWFADVKKTPCVILIDEYDDPVAQTLSRVEDAEKVRDELATIYHQIKDRVGKIRFMMMTGVSKFTKLSVFSVLSNLTDISAKPDWSALFGYTEEELDEYFSEHMAAHAKIMGLADAEYREQLKWWYNGYRFSNHSPVTVYNPVSIALTLGDMSREFCGTWTTTGRPSMLMNFIKREGLLEIDYENGYNGGEEVFDVSDLRNLTAPAMLYQTGYLTIGDYSDGEYTLVVPDEEVRRDLMKLVAAVAAQEDEGWVSQTVAYLTHADFESFFHGLKSLFAHLPYGAKEPRPHELSYERALKILFQARGLAVTCEDTQAAGRADLVVEHPRGIFIFELKRDESADAALDQIKQKGYAAPYLGKGLPVWGLGLNFDSARRQLDGHLVERLG